jgi:hypothetical protein
MSALRKLAAAVAVLVVLTVPACESEDPDAARRYTEAMEQEMESGSGASPR